MTGYDKIAILLAELGNGAREAVLEKLNFSSEQLKKISAATKKLRSYDGKIYNSKDKSQVNREIAVLEELKSFGELRGIYKDVPHGFIKTAASEEEKFRQSVMANPEAIAQALGKWLKSDD